MRWRIRRPAGSARPELDGVSLRMPLEAEDGHRRKGADGVDWSHLTDKRFASQLSTRLLLFVSVTAAAITLDIVARAALTPAYAHPLFHEWWLLVVLFVGAIIVRPPWGAAPAGLAAGGAVALSIDNQMQRMGGQAWSLGFLFAFAGAITMIALLSAQIVRIVPEAHRRHEPGGLGSITP